MQPHRECLPQAQRTLWPRLSVIDGDFVLYRGAAPALQIGGRTSVGFDSFTPEARAPSFRVKSAAKARRLLKGARCQVLVDRGQSFYFRDPFGNVFDVIED